MKQHLTIIILALTLNSCTHQQLGTSQDKKLENALSLTAVVQDSIDKYGFSGCAKPSNSEIQDYYLKALDSTWTLLLQSDKTNQANTIYAKEKFKDALINNGFIVDSLADWITATKKDFNERWQAEWDKDSNYVRLVVTRWHQGYTYAFVLASDKFDE